MTNPLDTPGGRSSIDLRAWCEELNAKPLCRRMGRWYFVRKVDGTEQIDMLEGCDGDNVRRLLAGTLPEFVGWSEARMEGYRRWLKSCAHNGSTHGNLRVIEHQLA